MSYILAGGCSYTDPDYECINYSREEMQQMGHGYRLGRWKMWPEYLGEKLNLEVINTGEQGSSNVKIYHKILNHTMDNNPKIIFVLWSEIDRFSLLKRDVQTTTMWRIYLASLLMLSKFNFKKDGFRAGSLYLDAWRFISIKYPDLLQETLDYYKNHPIITCYKNDHLTQSTSEFIPLLIPWYYNKEYTITNLLSPIYNTILLCIQRNISLVMAGGLDWELFGCYDWPHISGVDETRSRQTRNTFFKKSINKNFYNDVMSYITDWKLIKDSITKHELFWEIEELINKNNIICKGWPFTKSLGGYCSHDLEYFTQIGSKDNHPSPDGQRVIADLMYNAYTEL
jgi:hypothetical protein